MLYTLWERGRPFVWDVTVPDSLAVLYRSFWCWFCSNFCRIKEDIEVLTSTALLLILSHCYWVSWCSGSSVISTHSWAGQENQTPFWWGECFSLSFTTIIYRRAEGQRINDYGHSSFLLWHYVPIWLVNY